MIKEVNDHVSREHWIVVSVKDMIRNGYKEKPIMGVWSMKRKTNPLGVGLHSLRVFTGTGAGT